MHHSLNICHASMRKLVSIIVPVYNEEESLLVFHDSVTQVIDTLSNYDWEILYINDGSTDQTQAIIQQLFEKDKRIAFLQLSRNFGKENAMLAGFDYAHGNCAIVMDADLQDSPDLITDMLSNWEQGYEDVYAKRRSRGKESWLRRKCSMLFYNILERSIRFEVLKNVGDFRLLDRKCIDALKQLRENERYTKGLYCWIGFNKKEIVFDWGNRQYGKSHWDYFSLIGLAFDGIISFTTAPLRLSTILGFLTGFGAIVYFIWTLIKVIIWGDPVAGFPTLISVILILGSVQLICIGILGEYLGRVFNESKQRPNYLVSNYHQSRQ